MRFCRGSSPSEHFVEDDAERMNVGAIVLHVSDQACLLRRAL